MGPKSVIAELEARVDGMEQENRALRQQVLELSPCRRCEAHDQRRRERANGGGGSIAQSEEPPTGRSQKLKKAGDDCRMNPPPPLLRRASLEPPPSAATLRFNPLDLCENGPLGCLSACGLHETPKNLHNCEV